MRLDSYTTLGLHSLGLLVNPVQVVNVTEGPGTSKMTVHEEQGEENTQSTDTEIGDTEEGVFT